MDGDRSRPGRFSGVSAIAPAARWAAAPLIAYALSRPVPTRRAVLGPEDCEFLQSVAQKTWRYFETFVGSEDHALPPDNVQLVPALTVAHRTSPTNIGMTLLATLAAHDFGFISTDELADRTDATLTTVVIRRTTTCWPPKRGWPAFWRSPRATSLNPTGSIWDEP